MGHDNLPLAVEADVSIVSVDPKLSQLSHHQVGPVHAHVISHVYLKGLNLKCCILPNAQ